VLKRRLHAAGFTIIEVVVAMTIFAILVTLAVPSMGKWTRNVKVRASTDALQNGVRLAQAESLRRSRQVVFYLTGGTNWTIDTIPSMTDGSETNQLVASGVIGSITTGVTITGPTAICFNSVGRLVANSSTGVAGVTCTMPTATPPVWSYQIALAGADRPLQLNVALGGQVHMCDPAKTLSSTNPDGC
jgi:type IV fimbrial biogenesis protein FimT